MLFNRVRALDYMRRIGLDALVATSPVNVTYFSDYFCWLDPLVKAFMLNPGGSTERALQSYAVFPSEGSPALVVTPIFAANAADLWVKDIHPFGNSGLDDTALITPQLESARHIFESLQSRTESRTAVEALLSILRERGLTTARIGIELEGLSAASQEEILRALPRAEILNCSNLIRLVRMVKSSEELSRLTRAAEINETAAMNSLNLASSGSPVAEIVQNFRRRVAEAGADFDHFAFGIRGLGIAMEPAYVLSEDDVLYVDFGCLFQHYFSDGGTTLALREPSKEVSKRLSLLRGCLEAGAQNLRPRVRASAVRGEMWRFLTDHGITTSSPHGHGLGLEVRDYPILVENNGLRIQDDCVNESSDLVLECNMVINLESAIFNPGTGSLHIERSFVITEFGTRELVHQDRKGPVMPKHSGDGFQLMT